MNKRLSHICLCLLFILPPSSLPNGRRPSGRPTNPNPHNTVMMRLGKETHPPAGRFPRNRDKLTGTGFWPDRREERKITPCQRLLSPGQPILPQSLLAVVSRSGTSTGF